MDEAERLSALIGDIYDATLDPSLWPNVLARIVNFVGGATAGLMSKDSLSPAGNMHYNFGITEHYIQLYRETYWRFDPLAPLVFYSVGEVTAVTDILPPEEMHETRFFREWVKPQGWVDAANVILEKSATSLSTLIINRSETQGIVDNEMRRRMRLVEPHVRRAVLTSRVVEHKTAQADTFADMLDGLSASMFLVDANGRVMHANAAGRAMLAEGSFIRVVNGRLAPTDPGASRSLRAVFSSAGVDDSEAGTRGIAIPLAASQTDRFVAHALPLTSGMRRDTGNAYKAIAALFVHKASLDSPAPPETIAKTFKLTPAELRVMLAAVDVGGVASVAEILGISDNTVKTHLKRLYAKTGATRQADLVKLLAKFSSPLVG